MYLGTANGERRGLSIRRDPGRGREGRENLPGCGALPRLSEAAGGRGQAAAEPPPARLPERPHLSGAGPPGGHPQPRSSAEGSRGEEAAAAVPCCGGPGSAPARCLPNLRSAKPSLPHFLWQPRLLPPSLVSAHTLPHWAGPQLLPLSFA